MSETSIKRLVDDIGAEVACDVCHAEVPKMEIIRFPEALRLDRSARE